MTKYFGVVHPSTGKVLGTKIFDNVRNAKLSARQHYGNKPGVVELTVTPIPGTLEVIDKQTNKWTKGD